MKPGYRYSLFSAASTTSDLKHSQALRREGCENHEKECEDQQDHNGESDLPGGLVP